MKLDDPALDVTPSEARDALLLVALRRQIAFMPANVPFQLGGQIISGG